MSRRHEINSTLASTLRHGEASPWFDGTRFYLFGESAIVLEADANGSASRELLQRRITWLAGQLRRECRVGQREANGPGQLPAVILDVVPGDCNLTVFFEYTHTDVASLLEKLHLAWRESATHRADWKPKQHCLQVRYGGDSGPDLHSLATKLGISEDHLVSLHSECSYQVAFLGFQPGFAYLQGLPESLHCPRHASPRHSVPANSVAIGGSYTAVYPAKSPGGWHIIGRYEYENVSRSLFDPQRQPPNLLQAGDVVRFEAQC